MHHPTDRIAHTTAFVTPVVEHGLERAIAQWVHRMKDRSDDPSHDVRTLLPRSYISLQIHLEKDPPPQCEHCQCILTVRHILVECNHFTQTGARCSSVVRAFANGAMGRRIDPSWGGPIEIFIVPASGFPLSLSAWSFTICLTPYNRKVKCVECVVK